MRPFRWNIARREQLGRLVDGPATPHDERYLDDLRDCCARVLALSGDRDLVFVGRSPEGLFDYLSGLMSGTSWAERLRLLNVSLRFLEGRGRQPAAARAFAEHLAALDLSPQAIAARDRGLALVDVVDTGSTFGELVELVLGQAHDAGVDPTAVRRRLRIVGITRKDTPSPRAWRWQQHAQWTKAFRPSAIKNVAIDWRLWNFLGNTEEKVCERNPPWRWSAQTGRASHSEGQLKALRLARRVFDAGCEREHRLRFAAKLAQAPEMTQPWLRSLVVELRRA